MGAKSEEIENLQKMVSPQEVADALLMSARDLTKEEAADVEQASGVETWTFGEGTDAQITIWAIPNQKFNGESVEMTSFYKPGNEGCGSVSLEVMTSEGKLVKMELKVVKKASKRVPFDSEITAGFAKNGRAIDFTEKTILEGTVWDEPVSTLMKLMEKNLTAKTRSETVEAVGGVLKV